jgi:hypothetical protein
MWRVRVHGEVFANVDVQQLRARFGVPCVLQIGKFDAHAYTARLRHKTRHLTSLLEGQLERLSLACHGT